MALAESRTAPAAGSARSAPIEGLRAAACLFVLTAHSVRSVYGDKHTFAWRLMDRGGTLAIVVFFMLSGYFLYKPIASAHLAGRREPSSAKFYRRRLMRVLPAYWLALAAALFAFRSNRPHDNGDTALYFTLTEAYQRGYAQSGLFVAWTLVIEMGFYLTLPLLAIGLCRLTPARFDRRQRVLVQLATLVALGLVGIAFRWSILGNILTSWKLDWPLAWTDIFAWGMLLAVVQAWVSSGGRLPRPVEQLLEARWACWGILGVMVVYLAQLKLDASPTYAPTRPVIMEAFAAFGVAGVLLIAPFALHPSTKSIVMRGLGSAVGVYLGMIAYGIYLWHGVLLPHIDERAANGSLAAGFWPRMLLLVGGSCLLGAFSWHVIERPCAEWLGRWETRRGASQGRRLHRYPDLEA